MTQCSRSQLEVAEYKATITMAREFVIIKTMAGPGYDSLS